MAVKGDFKDSDLGPIPTDWRLASLADICAKIQDGTHFSPKTGGNDNFYVTSKNIGFGNLRLDSLETISREQHQSIYKRCDVKRGDVLLTKDGASTGNAAINTFDSEISLLSSVAFLRPKSENVNQYLLQQILSAACQSRIQESMAGNAITRLTLGKIKKFKIPLPPTRSEQEAIANALSDTDALIFSLGKLISKKRLIKKGVMQELVTGKRRIEGFSKTWRQSRLDEIVSFRRGSFPQPYGLDKWYDDTYGFPFVQVFDVGENGRVKTETKRKISQAAKELSVFVEKGSVILTIQGSIGRIAITDYDACVDRTLLIFEAFKIPFDKIFFKYAVFALFEIEKQKAPGGIITTITKESLSSFMLSYPPTDEQIRIAQILSDLDKDLELHEMRLSKLRLVKQGMMQELLTGRIRLI